MILNRSAILLDGFELPDISALLLEPGGIYRHPGYFFVVNAIFHEAIVFLGNCSSVCKSNIWRFTERPSIRTEDPHKERQLRQLYNEFSASPKDFALYV